MIIAFAPTHNSPRKKDATGAFIPEAKKFLSFHRQPAGNLVLVENLAPRKRMEQHILDVLRQPREAHLHGVAFFCHGLKNRIQFGFSDAAHLAANIATYAGPDVRVTFYACDAGRDDDAQRDDDLAEFGGDGGFADRVRDGLCVAGKVHCVVDAHTTAAHTTMNPDVRRFEGLGSPVGSVGGYYLVPRGSKVWKQWRAALRTDFRFEFPYLTTAEIHRRLLK